MVEFLEIGTQESLPMLNNVFSDHGVDKNQGQWAHHTTDTEDEARVVEKALFDLGCDGGTGGGDRPKTVYVYWKTVNTRE